MLFGEPETRGSSPRCNRIEVVNNRNANVKPARPSSRLRAVLRKIRECARIPARLPETVAMVFLSRIYTKTGDSMDTGKPASATAVAASPRTIRAKPTAYGSASPMS